MKTLSKVIYQKILDGYPLDEIAIMFSLSSKDFSKYLKDIKDNGYRFQRTIFSDGHIFLKPNQNLNLNPKDHRIRISVTDNRFKTLFISDTHIGNIRERIDYIKIAYDYALKHNIHIIINGGDTIDNYYKDRLQDYKITSVDSQIQKVIRVFPDIPGIVTLCLYGNHDAKSIIDQGRDIASFIESKRYDLLSLGYGACAIDLKSDSIGISHFIKKVPIKEILKNVSITFRGNSHKSKTSYKEEKEIYIPTLSDNLTNNYEYLPLPGFLVAEIIFYEKYIERINTTQLSIINNELRMSNEDALVLRNIPLEKRNPNYHR